MASILNFNKVSLNRKIRIGLGLSLFVLVLSSYISFYSIQKLIEQSQMVDHTNEVMIHLESIISFMKDAETGQRGYIATGDKKFLEPYLSSQENVMASYNKLRQLTADNPAQQKSLDAMLPLIKKRFMMLEEGISYYETNSKFSIEGLIDGKVIMDECRSLVLKMQQEEKQLLKLRTIETEKLSSSTPIVIIISSLFAILVSAFSLYFISRDIDTKARIQEDSNRINYLLSGASELNTLLQGEKSMEAACNKMLTYLCERMGAQAGILYMGGEDSIYRVQNRYAFENTELVPVSFKHNEGLIGQCAAQKKVMLLDKIPAESVRIRSGLTSTAPVNVLIVPFVYNDSTIAVMEILSKDVFKPLDLEFMETAENIISIFMHSLRSEIKTQELLLETQAQSEELATQQEELQQINEELEEQAQSLKQQQEELQVSNEELEHQRKSIELKNRELETASVEIQRKSKELELSSKYKSDFLANMSHELRTPLNSLLILSKDLADNKKQNLDSTQVESAQIIYNSGKDLLQLINEVLDLSKIEAGKMELNIEKLMIQEFSASLKRNFHHVVSQKRLDFSIAFGKDIPEFIYTDRQRLDQILRNLLSNAIKFTQTGGISLIFRKFSKNMLAIEVQDTGIGIPEEKQALIFEAFQQADGSTSRKYGGTGLGLSISRELIKLLGGFISLKSELGVGSTFTVVVPFSVSTNEGDFLEPEKEEELSVGYEKSVKNESIRHGLIEDDRQQITKKDKSILIIEDDLKFVKILQEMAREKKFKTLVATSGEEGLMLAHQYNPQAILLDLILPGMSGKTVLSELKNNPSLRHIPVHVISASDRTLDTIKGGAVEFMRKPVDRPQLEEAFQRIENFLQKKMRNLLIVEDDANARRSIKLLIGNGDVHCIEAGTGQEALDIIKEGSVDCVILDLGLPDMTGFELIKKLQDTKVPPIIVYTGKELTKEENDELQNFAETIIIKGVKSEERLLDEASLFLHRTINNLPDHKKQIIIDLHNKETIFLNKKVLLVDDDMRNVFALAKILKETGMEVYKAENGIKALEALDQHPDMDIVLMDIMMPEMDGYEAMRRIRAQERFIKLPMLALTAKAMKEDRKKCIDAGANDYVSKPIELERLLSLMRVWITK